jgi:hypothetical protein
MTPGELTKAVAGATLMPEATVTAHARMLREAGLLTTGARGVNAPEMTPLDAARLLLSVMVTERPSRAVDAVRDFGSLVCVQVNLRDAELTLDRYNGGLPKHHTFEKGIETLIGIYAFDIDKSYYIKSSKVVVGDLVIEPDCEVKIKIVQLVAEIVVPGAQYIYGEPRPELPAAPHDVEGEEFEEWVIRAGNVTDEINRRTKNAEKYNKSRIHIEKVIETDIINSLAISFFKGRQ